MEEISTDDAPASIGPFSQAIRSGDRIYVSGQGPIDPESGEIVDLSHHLPTEGYYLLTVWVHGQKRIDTNIDAQYDWAIGIWSDSAITADNLQT